MPASKKDNRGHGTLLQVLALAQQRLNLFQHVTHDLRLCRGNRVQVVGLKLFRGNILQQKRQQP